MIRVTALLATYNEERFVRTCIEHLIAQGCDVYLIDNESTDTTVAIAKEYEGRGLRGIETLPRAGSFDLGPQLACKEELAESLDADWFIHVDADEFHMPPQGEGTLAAALHVVDLAEYNAVRFIEYTFFPTREEPDHDRPDFQRTMHSYYPFTPRPLHVVRAWKKQQGRVDLASSGGHAVDFPGRKIWEVPFIMKHYPILSETHAREKYVERTFHVDELDTGWHKWRSRIKEDRIKLPKARKLKQYVDDAHLDDTGGRKHHWHEGWATKR